MKLTRFVSSLMIVVAFAIAGAAIADPVPYEGQTANGDYTISSANQLVSLANHVPSGGFSSSTFTLLNDIDMSGISWTRPIGLEKAFAYYTDSAVPFKGKFDGGGHVIRNLNVYCSKDASCGSSAGWGLFGRVLDAEIRNLTVEGTIGGERSTEVGLLVGCVDANTTISNCTVCAEVVGLSNSYGTNIGAMIGRVSGANCVIADCTASGTVGGYEGGGLVGRVTAASVFQRCQADTHVTATNCAAAFVTVAQSGARFEDCQAKGMAESSDGGAAGFAYQGQTSACFVNCAAAGDVVAWLRGGGFVCCLDLSSYTNCVAKGDVTVRSAASRYGYSENAAGGFAGILGANGATCVRCTAEGNVNSQGSGGYVGGFLGNGYNAAGTFRQCRASGNCEGEAKVGGFAGYIRFASTNDQCFAIGDVVSRGTDAGGFVGHADKLYCFNSYSSGHVTGTTQVGGFVGWAANGCFTNCYSVGGYECSDSDGYKRYDGFLGHTSYTVSIGNCFALENRLAWSGVTVLTDAQFLEPTRFNAWPKDIWWLPLSDNVSRPQLKWSYQDEGTVVPSVLTGSHDLVIPNAWFVRYPTFETKFGSEKASAAVQSTGKKTAEGSEMSVWQDYVTGNDPTDSNSVFAVSIAVTNGVPYIGWSPYLNSNGTTRIYQILGKDSLTNDVWLAAASTNHFFKVSVAMPSGTEASDAPGAIAGE